MGKKDPKSPATTSYAYDIMLPRWDKITCLLGGTETMRAAGSTYLPKHPEESAAAHRERLNTTVLLNMVDMTLTSLVSRPFGAPIKVGDDVPEKLKSMLDDVDLQGTSLDRFARNWFKDGVAKGFSAVLVEFPRVDPGTPEQPRTKADDEGLRPYLVHIPPESIIFASCEYVNGKEVLKEVRIHEEVVEQEGYAEVIKERIRVLKPGFGEVFEKRKDPRTKKVEWVSIEKYEYDLDFIPLVVFYADRQGFMLSKPPLTDLADLNILHWQSTSDQIAILTVSRFPMLACSGSVDSETVVVGPNNVLSMTDPQGRFYYVEHTGKAIAAGRQHLLDLEEVMAEYGATFLKKRPGGATATARALDSAEVTSALQDMAFGFQDSLNLALYYMGCWVNEENTGTLTVKTDFGLSDKAESGLKALIAARKMGDIDRKNFLLGLIRYGVLPEGFPIDEVETALDKELKAQSAQEARAMETEAKINAE